MLSSIRTKPGRVAALKALFTCCPQILTTRIALQGHSYFLESQTHRQVGTDLLPKHPLERGAYCGNDTYLYIKRKSHPKNHI